MHRPTANFISTHWMRVIFVGLQNEYPYVTIDAKLLFQNYGKLAHDTYAIADYAGNKTEK